MGNLAWFLGGALFGTVGLDVLKTKEAKKAATVVTAAVLRCKDQVMKGVEKTQEQCSDILADAKALNEERVKNTETKTFIEDTSEVIE